MMLFSFIKKFFSRTTKSFFGDLADKRKKDIKRMVQKTLKRKHLTKWELNFIKSIKSKTFLTEKQFSKLTEIYKIPDVPRFQKRTNNLGRELDKRFLDKYGYSWDEAHDFDRD